MNRSIRVREGRGLFMTWARSKGHLMILVLMHVYPQPL